MTCLIFRHATDQWQWCIKVFAISCLVIFEKLSTFRSSFLLKCYGDRRPHWNVSLRKKRTMNGHRTFYNEGSPFPSPKYLPTYKTAGYGQNKIHSSSTTADELAEGNCVLGVCWCHRMCGRAIFVLWDGYYPVISIVIVNSMRVFCTIRSFQHFTRLHVWID